jgi:hypothetical protein
MRCSLEGDRRFTSLVFSVVWGSRSGRGDDVLHFRGVALVQLQDHVAELVIATDAGRGKLRLGLAEPHSWSAGQNGGGRTATLDISAAVALLVVPEPCWFVLFFFCLAVRVRCAVRLVNSAAAICTAEGGLLSDCCPLFVLYCRVHQ